MADWSYCAVCPHHVSFGVKTILKVFAQPPPQKKLQAFFFPMSWAFLDKVSDLLTVTHLETSKEKKAKQTVKVIILYFREILCFLFDGRAFLFILLEK